MAAGARSSGTAARAKYAADEAYLAVPHIEPHPEKAAALVRKVEANRKLRALVAGGEQ